MLFLMAGYSMSSTWLMATMGGLSWMSSMMERLTILMLFIMVVMEVGLEVEKGLLDDCLIFSYLTYQINSC